ncbi:hypothetical protein Nepgr_020277 [Nepenthes gracilis]|uniref:Uncharacterized protein n=1 Tax=Nepenthes gracilis TaxID=150966 RepID=A0AAD3XW72_NEPGR|nr:hypothetical protein Nepgr_020277 [Nepenthes gracilis]
MLSSSKLLSLRPYPGAFLCCARPSLEDVVAAHTFSGKLDPVGRMSSQVPWSGNKGQPGLSGRGNQTPGSRPWSRMIAEGVWPLLKVLLEASKAPRPDVLTAWVVGAKPVWRTAWVLFTRCLSLRVATFGPSGA